MFHFYLGQTVKEEDFFHELSELIQKNFNQLVLGHYYFFRFEKVDEVQSKITEVRHFYCYSDYADFIYAHEYQPNYLFFFVRKGEHIHMAMNGHRKFMSHKIYETVLKYPYVQDQHAGWLASKMPPREIMEKGFGAIAGQLNKTGRGSKSTM
jgi:hypothetical protein